MPQLVGFHYLPDAVSTLSSPYTFHFLSVSSIQLESHGVKSVQRVLSLRDLVVLWMRQVGFPCHSPWRNLYTLS